ncbi:hypothetical protein SAMN03159423_4809 [Bradyrhizobium sp. NFR13]|nr:hypothetical protein SAMN03159423_4809 [Bradyrhizobium sp. NFR13]
MTPAARQRRIAKREQKRSEMMTALSVLRQAGQSCASCKHIRKAPFGFGPGVKVCELDSDSEGYAIVEQSGLCVRHTSALTPPTLETPEAQP